MTILILLFAFTFSIGSGSLSVENLRCEYQRDPIAVGVAAPRLSWTLVSTERGARQTAFQILAASCPEKLAEGKCDLWDSGKVASDQSIQVEYAGQPLGSGAECFWKVRAWDVRGKPGPWSVAARWKMGLLKPGDWSAAWIRADLPQAVSPWFRKTFALESVPQHAYAYVNAVGYYELYVNGRKVGGDVLSPAVSDCRTRTLYVAYDIGPFLKKGRNCIGLWCGRGWSRQADPPGPRIRFQCDVAAGKERRGGRPAVRVATDATWKAAASPYTTTGSQSWGAFGGELLDSNLQAEDWSAADFNDAAWSNALDAACASVPAEPQVCPPNRLGQRLPAVACRPLAEGRCELDFGANLTGWLHLRMAGLKAGQRVAIYYADRRYAEGDMKGGGPSDRVFPGLPGPVRYQMFNQKDEFVSAGRRREEFQSKFNYHGFRYAIVEGLPVQPAAADATALLVESDLEPAGSFACSNALLDRIHRMTLWTIRCLNLGGYMVDCPHRERLGYGDGQVSVEGGVYNLWMPAFYSKWAADWRDSQNRGTGEISHTAPDWGGGGGPAWGGSLAALTWRMYEYYGDRRILAENYEPMRRYVDFLESRCRQNVLRGYGGQWDFIGDWVPPERGMDTHSWPSRDAAELFNNCYRAYLWELLEKSAVALGRADEARRCRAALAEMRPAIDRAFYDASKGTYVIDEQAYQVMPLMAGVVPPEREAAIFAKLKDGILNRCKGHLDTGMLGTYFLIEYLHATGNDDLLYTIAGQETYPGWGYMLSRGATTIWEQWNGYWSHIHSCFASLDGWLYEGLGGIQPDPSAAGFKRIIIRPAPVGDVTWVKAHHDSMYGRISSAWKRSGREFELDVTIPANTTATVYVPAGEERSVTESGKPASGAEGLRFMRMEGGRAVYAVGAGTYRFRSTM